MQVYSLALSFTLCYIILSTTPLSRSALTAVLEQLHVGSTQKHRTPATTVPMTMGVPVLHTSITLGSWSSGMLGQWHKVSSTIHNSVYLETAAPKNWWRPTCTNLSVKRISSTWTQRLVSSNQVATVFLIVCVPALTLRWLVKTLYTWKTGLKFHWEGSSGLAEKC